MNSSQDNSMLCQPIVITTFHGQGVVRRTKCLVVVLKTVWGLARQGGRVDERLIIGLSGLLGGQGTTNKKLYGRPRMQLKPKSSLLVCCTFGQNGA